MILKLSHFAAALAHSRKAILRPPKSLCNENFRRQNRPSIIDKFRTLERSDLDVGLIIADSAVSQNWPPNKSCNKLRINMNVARNKQGNLRVDIHAIVPLNVKVFHANN